MNEDQTKHMRKFSQVKLCKQSECQTNEQYCTILSLIVIFMRCLELWISWILIQSDEIEFDAFIWFFLQGLLISYNIIMIAAIIYNYNQDFKDFSRLIKCILIILTFFDLDSLILISNFSVRKQNKNKITEIISEKLDFIYKSSILNFCSLCYLMSQEGRNIYLSMIILVFVYSLIMLIFFYTLGEQIRIIQVFYLGVIHKITFIYSCDSLTCALILNESIILLILLVISIRISVKQENSILAFTSQYTIKESLRLIFFKPMVIIKDFKFINTSSISSLIKLYKFKIKFKHLSYVWRIIENLVISTYLIFQRDSFLKNTQVVQLTDSISYGNFHYYLNIVISILSYLYTLHLIIRLIKIINFSPIFSQETINLLNYLETAESNEIQQNNLHKQSNNFNENLNKEHIVRKYSNKSELKRLRYLQKESISQKRTAEFEIYTETGKKSNNIQQSHKQSNHIRKIQSCTLTNENINQLQQQQQKQYNKKKSLNTFNQKNKQDMNKIKMNYIENMINSPNLNEEYKLNDIKLFMDETNQIENINQDNMNHKQKYEMQFCKSNNTIQNNDSPSNQDKGIMYGNIEFNNLVQKQSIQKTINCNDIKVIKIPSYANIQNYTENSAINNGQKQTMIINDLNDPVFIQHMTSPSNVALLQTLGNEDQISNKSNNNQNSQYGNESIFEATQIQQIQ